MREMVFFAKDTYQKLALVTGDWCDKFGVGFVTG
jgi:hypothetical protein